MSRPENSSELWGSRPGRCPSELSSPQFAALPHNPFPASQLAEAPPRLAVLCRAALADQSTLVRSLSPAQPTPSSPSPPQLPFRPNHYSPPSFAPSCPTPLPQTCFSLASAGLGRLMPRSSKRAGRPFRSSPGPISRISSRRDSTLSHPCSATTRSSSLQEVSARAGVRGGRGRAEAS